MNAVHPVRAVLAVGAVAATIYMMIAGINMPDAWWVIITGLSLFYVEGQLKA